MPSADLAGLADQPTLETRARRLLSDVFGYADFRGDQAEAVCHVAAGRDALVLMPTGGGKSLCFQIPALLRPGLGVVVSPLIALMQDQVAALREAGVRAACLNSALTWHEAESVERQVRAGELDLLYVAPERLLTERCLDLLDAVPLALFAIDEAHCVSQWGHDFRPEYIRLSALAVRYPSVPRVALTATADAGTRAEIVSRLGLREPRIFVSSFDRPNIRYRIADKAKPRDQLLAFIRAEHSGDCGIVYCLSRASVDETAAYLVRHGVSALPYHAGLAGETREAHQTRFLREDGLVMVATIAFGMGIDKPDVRFVAHLDLPKSIEGYYQETGRAGRDGLPADAWMVYGLGDVVQQRRLIELSDAVAEWRRLAATKLDAVLGLCETVECRRVRLLGYFGEESAPCGNCDNCLVPPERWDATEAARKLMSCIYRCTDSNGFGFGAQHVIDVLCGKSTPKVIQYGHERLTTFGLGADADAREWRSVLRQLVTLGLVRVDAANFNVLKLTALSREVLRGTRRLELRRDSSDPALRRAGRRRVDPARAGELAAVENPGVFEALRSWRREVAKEHGVPAYTVFHDSTLREIAQALPTSMAALHGITGVGAVKLERFGAALIEVVAAARDAVGGAPTSADPWPSRRFGG
jgi:ATP-dependent DNA helicase RecQ